MDSAQTVNAITGSLAARCGLGIAALFPAVLARLDREPSMTVLRLARDLAQPPELLAHCIAQLLHAQILERGPGYNEVQLSRFWRELLRAAAAPRGQCRENHLSRVGALPLK